jgi:hypothetical protein
MPMSSISIVAVGAAVIAALAGLLSYLLKRPLNMASTSGELLDLFEERYTTFEEHLPSTSRNDESRAPEEFGANPGSDPTPPNASPIALATSAQTSAAYPRQSAGRSILDAARNAMAVSTAWRRYGSRRARLAEARLAELRSAHFGRPQLGAYEKARVERYLNEIRVGRMTYAEAQDAIASGWIAAYGPMVRNRGIHSPIVELHPGRSSFGIFA